MSTIRTNAVQTVDGRPLLNTAGSIVQCVVVRTDTRTTFSAPGSGNGTVISQLNLTITPRNSANRIICKWMVNGEFNNENALFTIYQDGSLITQSGAQGYNSYSNSRWTGAAPSVYDRNNSSTPQNTVIFWSGIAGSTSSRSYRPAVRSSNSSGRTFYLNRCVASSNNGQNAYEITVSTGVCWEVAV